MKRILLILSIFICSISLSQSTLVGLVLETVDNSSAGFSNNEVTYRLYAELNGGQITHIFGDQSNPLSISTSTTFFENTFGEDIQGLVNSAFFTLAPFASLPFDTWLTIGDSYTDPASKSIGLDLETGFANSNLYLGGGSSQQGSIFRSANNSLCFPDVNGYVLLGQFTTTGELSGFINLIGKDDNGNDWTEYNISIPSLGDANIPGCTDSTAYNFDASANIDDGSCIATVNGCTDSSASNFDSSANTDDGSCNYQPLPPLAGLVLEIVDNSSGEFTSGELTYRLYAELNSGLITFIFADEINPLEISTSTSFVDDPIFGADIQGLVNDNFFGFIPSLAYDTWLTIGDAYASEGDAASTTPGLDLSGFSGSSLSLGGTVNSDAAIFRTPDDPLCLPDANGYVLLGQFTTTGDLSGFINLMGKDANGNEWSETNIPIPSIGGDVLGCTDPNAINYNTWANSDDGSCVFCIDIDSFISNESCDSYDWNGVTYTESGTYTFETTNSLGCDSTATLTLTINNSSTSQESVTVCDSYDWNGVTYTESGTYTYESTNDEGCTNVATLTLTINSSTTSQETVTACDSYEWNGTIYYESGVYLHESSNDVGCSNVDILNLTINNSTTSQESATVCDSYDWNGTTFTESGTYTYESTNDEGCINVATLTLIINNSTPSFTIANDCDTYDWNGVTYTESGTYTYESTNDEGCINVATLILVINNSSTTQESATVCDSYDWNGVTYTESGTYNWVGLNSNGCDSIVIIDLTIINSYYTNNNVSLCFGESIDVGNNTYNETGSYIDTLTTVNGCDSIVTTNLTLYSDIVSIITQSGSDITVNAVGGTSPYSYQWITGEVTESITPLTNGNYWVIVNDINFCESDTSFFNVDWTHTSLSEIYINDLIIYPNPSNDVFNIMFNSYAKQDINLTIHNILGEVIISETLRSFSGDYSSRINMSQYPNAIYILKLTTNNGMINRKLTLD